MRVHVARLAALSAAALLGWGMTMAAPAPEAKRTPEAIAKAKAAVEEELDKLKGGGAAVAYVKDEAVESALPRHYLFSVLFRQFPVGRRPPQGLRPSNLFAADAQGRVEALPDVKALEKFCAANLAPAREDAQVKTDLRAWLRLAQQYHQDGFYQFAVMDDTLKVAKEGENKVAGGTVVAMRGGSGTLAMTLTFSESGKLVKASEENKLRPGPRPICQATKLLDRDPLVRRMAEQDLLIMGPACRDYLNEQRAQAPAELRRAIDRIWERIRDAER
jgi:hypothetical protein